ncbi:MAG: bifunctional pyr operon transcriptional regulator/uracil phosphoribosyltransferase PyrR [Saprospiraceae bacterium]|nr:bifunctional pyr operon transcriptional regulator/uracil phosphoribosyltransferase PyrR [Saprospiraceae bacterium]
MNKGKLILSPERFQLTIERLCYLILERHLSLENVCFLGVQERGVFLAERLLDELKTISSQSNWNFGKLDITFYRDDFRRRDTPLRASTTEIDFLVENKNVILIDDVLYTGRTVHAAMSAISDYGRPSTIEMLCMVDRRFNRQFPIKADFVGITVDSVDEAYVSVEYSKIDGKDQVLLFSGKDKNK